MQPLDGFEKWREIDTANGSGHIPAQKNLQFPNQEK
jgi:hypothetical protein